MKEKLKETLRDNWKPILLTIFVLMSIFSGVIWFNYAKDCHWIFEEIPFDTAYIDKNHQIRTKVNVENCNTITIQVTGFFTAAVNDDSINGVYGIIIFNGHPVYADSISVSAWMFNEDLITLNIGDIITVTGDIDYHIDKIRSTNSIYIGSSVDAFFVGHPARFSNTMEG